MRVDQMIKFIAMWVATISLVACGGGSSSSSIPNPDYQAGIYAPSSQYFGHCAAPRAGTPDVKGTAVWENFWLRSWTHELYLWYSEVSDFNPYMYVRTADYFETQKTMAVTASGQYKDRFHFTYPTDQWIALSQSGVSAGYGVTWAALSRIPLRHYVVAYMQPGAPAPANTLVRGEEVLTVDGVDINDNTENGISILSEGLYPTVSGGTHTFTLRALDNSTRTMTMTASNITETPVLNYQSPGIINTTNGKVGYLIFNDHFATAESELVTAINTLNQNGISDLILDLRYNGGGYLDIAAELAYMIAGSNNTAGKIFERAVFNNQYAPNVNPVTKQSNTPTPFHSTAQGFSLASGTALPTLNLSKVYVITGVNTCSASEAIINGLNGAGIQVIQIGSTTCGKPYGFYPQDNCGTTYFSIEMKGENNAGFGDYGDGFSPENTNSGFIGKTLPGCSVADDFTKPLGDVTEGRLAQALYYRANSACSVPPSGISGRMQAQAVNGGVDLSAAEGIMRKGAWRENRILSH